MIEEEHIFELLPGYALGCLDDEDLLQVARHLPLCPVCRSELASYWPVVDQLPLAVPAVSAPEGVRAKILERAAQTAQLPAAAPAARQKVGKSSPAAPGRKGILGWLASLKISPTGFALGALAVLLVVFMAASNLALWQQVNDLRERVPDDHIRIVELQGTQNVPGCLRIPDGVQR